MCPSPEFNVGATPPMHGGSGAAFGSRSAVRLPPKLKS